MESHMANALHRTQPPADKHGENAKPRRRSGVSGPLMFAIVIAATIFVMSVFFRVSNISVEGNTHYTDDEIIRAIDIEEGDNLFFFDRFAAVSRVFAKLPYVEKVTVERQLPNRVIVNIVESRALAYLQLGDEQWTLDHNCKVLGKAAEGETGSLISIEGVSPGTLLIGETMQTAAGDGETVAYLSEVLSQLQDRELYTETRSIDFSDLSDVEFTYGDKYTVVLGGSDNIEHKFGMLVSVLGQLKEGDIGIIDVSDGTTAHFSPN